MSPTDALPLLLPHLDTKARVLCIDDATAQVLQTLMPGLSVIVGDPEDWAGGDFDACLLLDGSVEKLGIKGPVLIAQAIGATRAGGLIAVMVPSARTREAAGEPGGILAEDLIHMLTERGLDPVVTYAPGVGAKLAERAYNAKEDEALDKTPGLLDAGDHILTLACTWHSSEERTNNFMASLPMRVAAATAICRHPESGDLLCVFDSFKNGWTLPGGVVDKHESPQQGAIRECLEEAGVQVQATGFAGLFTHSDPERLHFLYFTEVVGEVIEQPVTAHPHEIDEVAWIPLDEAVDKLNRYMWEKVTLCLSHPGKTWPYGEYA